MKKPQLTPYLAVGAASLSAGQADAATIVTLYGPGAQNPSTDPATPAGININDPGGVASTDDDSSSVSVFAYGIDQSAYFTRGTELSDIDGGFAALYAVSGSFFLGGIFGEENYANISFDGDDDIYEAVGQFFFDGAGGGYLVAIAENDDGSALSISAGKAAIDAIPEPTTAGLLALGAAGLATLRRRKRA